MRLPKWLRWRSDEELDVAPLRCHRRATRTAVDPRRAHRGDEAAVEPAVPALRCPVALLVVEDHDAIVARPTSRD